MEHHERLELSIYGLQIRCDANFANGAKNRFTDNRKLLGSDIMKGGILLNKSAGGE